MAVKVITLKEYQPVQLPPEALRYESGELLWSTYGKQVQVEFPSPRSNGQWELTAKGWVGQIPLAETTLILQPKTALQNLFTMLLGTYGIQWDQLPGLVGVESASLLNIYQYLATALGQGVLELVRQGISQQYLMREAALPYVRGRLDLNKQLAKPATARVYSQYRERTSDIPANQILLWTLRQMVQQGDFPPACRRLLQQAYRALPEVALRPFTAAECRQPYNRLNQQYRYLHTLCYFFLSQSAPVHQLGPRQVRPYLVEMPRLYEQFVASWLQQHLPQSCWLQSQENVALGAGGEMQLYIDLVLYDSDGGRPLAVLDTKYKTGHRPANADIYQAAFYAHALGVRHAYLIYPQPLARPLDLEIDGVRVRSVTFALDGDLDAAGHRFLQAVGLAA